MREKFITVTCLTHKFDRGNCLQRWLESLSDMGHKISYGSYDHMFYGLYHIAYMDINIGLDDMAYLIQSIIHENHMDWFLWHA